MDDSEEILSEKQANPFWDCGKKKTKDKMIR